MLILTRRVGETLMIGDEVTVTVLGVKGNQVRVGVNAPKDVAVHREEIYERIEQPIQKLQVASALHNRIAATDPSRAAELRGQGRLSPRGGIDGEILQGCLLEQLSAK